jgi:hypothetical protein
MCWLPQQESRVEHRERLDISAGLTWIGEPRAPRTRNPSADAQDCASCGSTEANQVFRVGELNLPLNERQTDLRLLKGRGSVARRPPWYDIGDVDVLSIQSNRAQHAIQQLPRSSNEWAPDSIFTLPWGLAD